MNREEFKDYLKKWYSLNSNKVISEVFAETLLHSIEKTETAGDFIFEDDSIVLGRYCYSCKIDNTDKELCFVIYGIGRKFNITDEDYELESYNETEYIIL